MKRSLDRWGKERSLPVALSKLKDGNVPLSVLAVHLRHAELAREFRGKRLKIRVKYGSRGESLRCDTAEFIPELHVRPKVSRLVHRQLAPCARVELGSTCLFLLSSDVEPVVRVAVRRAGLQKGSVAKGSAELVDLKEGCVAEVPLCGPKGENIGRLAMACEVVGAGHRDLITSLALTCAEKQKNAYLVSGAAAPVVQGELVDASSKGTPPWPEPPLAGLPISLKAE